MKKILKLLYDVLSFIPFIIIICFFIKVPFYFEGVGGITNLDKKISIENEYISKGSINSTYVIEYKSNLLMYTIALLLPNIDIYNEEDYLLPNETYEVMSYRDRLKLKESVDNAIIYAYNKAGINIDIENIEYYVTYILNTNTDLKIGDRIIKINGIDIKDISDVNDIISNKDTINIEVINNNVTYNRYVNLMNIDGSKYLGVILTTKKDYDIKGFTYKYNSKESGPSAGFMLALSIYDKLTSYDITKGLKIVGTGTIDLNGNIGSIGGVKYKVIAAIKASADIFFVPIDNYEEAIKYNNGKLNIIGIDTFDDAIKYLRNI